MYTHTYTRWTRETMYVYSIASVKGMIQDFEQYLYTVMIVGNFYLSRLLAFVY